MIGTGIDVRVKIQDIVSSQLPEFILSEAPLTDDFLKQFYVSQEFQGGTMDFAANLDQYINLNNLNETVIAGEFELTQPVSETDTVVYVNSTKSFPNEWGLLKVNDEIMTYTGVTTNTFTGVVRGFSGITSYHAEGNPGELVFETTTAASHADKSPVQNLSTLFLKEFYNKIKFTFAPGFENLDFDANIDVGNWIRQARSFYQTKGSAESIEILFRVLYGEDPTVIDLEQFLIKPSEAEYSRRDYAVGIPVEGNPRDLQGRTIFQEGSTDIFGAVSEIEPFFRDGQLYYKIFFFVSTEEISNERKLFAVPGASKAHRAWSQGDRTLTVDTTIGFRDNGKFVTADGVEFTYEDRTVNQFLGVTCSDPTKTVAAGDDILDDIKVIGTNPDGEEISLRLTGVLSDITFPEEVPFSSVGEKIRVDTLGENIVSPSASREPQTYPRIIANSFIYNTSVRFEVESVSGSEFVLTAPFLDKSSLNVGDTVDILPRGSQTPLLSSRLVSGIDFQQATVTIDDSFGVPINAQIDIRRNQKYASSSKTPIDYGNDAVLSNVLNLYDAREYDSNFYVATNSLPSYEVDVSIVESTISDIQVLNFEDYDSFSMTYSTLVFDQPVEFITGDLVTYSVQPGIGTTAVFPICATGEYYVEVLPNPRKIRLYLSPSFIGGTNIVPLTANTEPGTHIFTLESQKDREIVTQKTYRTIPITGDTQNITIDRPPAKVEPGKIAILTNGVEVTSYISGDKVYLGPLVKVDTTSKGEGYSVTSPPSLTVAAPNLQLAQPPTQAPETAELTPVIKGKLESILIDPQDFDINKVFRITVTGGNSSGASADPILEKKNRQIPFDSRLDTLGGGVNPNEETIQFITDHNLAKGTPVVYNNRGTSSIGVTPSFGNNFSSGAVLSNGGVYYAEPVNNLTIRLYTSIEELELGTNPVGFSSNLNGYGVQSFDTLSRNTIIGANIIEDGGDFWYRTLKTQPSNIFVEYDEVRYPNHGFKTGEVVEYVSEGTPIVGLSTVDSYLVVSEDEDTFKLCNAGVGATSTFNYDRLEYVNFETAGVGTHIFKYPDVKVNVTVSFASTITGIVTATPVIRGEIDQVYVDNGGYYGSDILNFQKNPKITVSKGQGAKIKPLVVDGQIVALQILSKGFDYPDVPDLVVTDASGSGVGASLRAIVVDGRIEDVIILNGGLSYSNLETSVEVVDPGERSILTPRIRSLDVNLQERFGFESLVDNSYAIVSYERTIREDVYSDVGDIHSPIIGWANDGNPIYGGFGYSDGEDQNSDILAMATSYVLDPSATEGRPSLVTYPAGFFVQDYVYTGNGDLDLYNGRYCRTPEFPNGVYAYFAGISTDVQSLERAPQFPYFIGPEYRDAPLNTSEIDQSFNINDKPIYRNTFPYYVGSPFAGSDFMVQSYLEGVQDSIIQSVKSGTIKSIDVIGAGNEYRVGDVPVFESSDDTVSSVVAEVLGKEIVSIASSISGYGKLATKIIRESASKVRVYVYPSHDFLNGDQIVFSGLSTTTANLAGPKKIVVDNTSMTLASQLPSSVIEGVDDIYVNTISDNVSIGSPIVIGITTGVTETAEVIDIFPANKVLRIRRPLGNPLTAPIGSPVDVVPNYFDVAVRTEEFKSELDVVYNFNPTQTIGAGLADGVGVARTFTVGNVNYDISVPTRSIYAPSHGFRNNEPVLLERSLSSALLGYVDPSTGFTQPLPTGNGIYYAANIGKDLVGIKTSPQGEPVYFTPSGTDNWGYKLSTLRTAETAIVDKVEAIVTTQDAHGMKSGDSVSVSVVSNRSSGVGSNTAVVFEFDEVSQSLVVDPKFTPSTGINTQQNLINVNDHGYDLGGYVLYETDGTPIGGLEPHQKYFTIPFDKDNFQVAKTFEDIKPGSQLPIDLTSTGSGTHKFSGVNPDLRIVNENNAVFDVSSGTLLGKSINFYYDQDLTEIFESNGADTDFVVTGVSTEGYPGAEKVLNFSKNNPQVIYYGLEFGGYISTADTNANLNNSIRYVDSTYSETRRIEVLDDFSFSYSLFETPEIDLYDQLNSKLTYTTSSRNTTGGIAKVNIISAGSNFNSLPEFITVDSRKGNTATLVATSDDIGVLSSLRIQNPGWGYSADNTLRPAGNIQPKVEFTDSDFVTSIEILDAGQGYQNAPNAVLVDSVTREVIDNGSIILEVQSSSISDVNIELPPTGLSKNSHELYTINNSNGIPILNFEGVDQNTGIATYIMQTPINQYAVIPFEVGDKVFIENLIPLDGSPKLNLNSDEYGYKFFDVVGVVTSNPIKVSVQYPEDSYGTYGEAQAFQGAFSSIVNKKLYPTFNVSQGTAIFNVGESISVFDEQGNLIETGLVVEESNTNFFKYRGSYILLPGDVIKGSVSGVIVTILTITKNECRYSVSSISRISTGWRDEIGFLNEELQVTPDNDYYQNLSYSIKSEQIFEEWISPVNRLVHPSGLKNFADTKIESVGKVGAGFTADGTDSITIDLIGLTDVANTPLRVDRINVFDLGYDDEINDNRSNAIRFNSKTPNKRLTDYLEVQTNRVLMMDDISNEFVDSDNARGQEDYTDFPVITSSFTRGVLLARNPFTDQAQFTEIVTLTTNNNAFTLQKARVSDNGPGYGDFDAVALQSTEYTLRFSPFDVDSFDIDYKLLTGKFVFEDLASQQLGNIELAGETIVCPAAAATRLYTAAAGNDAICLYIEITEASGEISYYEVYAFILNGEPEIATYGMNTNEAENYNDTPPGEFIAVAASGGRIAVNFENQSGGDITMTTRDTVFRDNATGDSIYRFKRPSLANGDERSIILAGTKTVGLANASSTDIFAIDATDFQAIRSVVFIKSAEFGAIHQVMSLNSDGSTFVDEYPFINKGNGIPGPGVGTFGSEIVGNTWTVRFYPDAGLNPLLPMEFIGYHEAFYREYDTKNYVDRPLTYSQSEENYFLDRYIAPLGPRNNKLRFPITYEGVPIYEKNFEPDQVITAPQGTSDLSIFNINDHFFSSKEELYYEPGASINGAPFAPIEIRPVENYLGITTTLMPERVFAIKRDLNRFQLAATENDAIQGNAIVVTSFGLGNEHRIGMVKKLQKSLVTIDGVVQSPISSANLVYDLDANVGAADTLFTLTGIGTVRSGDLLRVSDEYVIIDNVGFATSPDGPINNIGSVPLIEVTRGAVGSIATDHPTGIGMTLYRGSYNIVESDLVFTEAPTGRGEFQINENNLVELNSSFQGRVFLQKEYDQIAVYDDISDQFDGTKNTFTLSSLGQTTGIGTTGGGIENGSGVLIINDIYQTPTTDNNEGNNYFYSYDEVSGINSVTFTGITSANGQRIESEFDVNQNQIPRGGLIVSLGSTPGLGYAPLVGASITPVIVAGSVVGIVTTNQIGVTRAIRYADYNQQNGELIVSVVGINSGSPVNIIDANYLEESGILVIQTAIPLSAAGIESGDIITLSSILFSCNTGTKQYPDKNDTFIVGSAIDTDKFTVNVGVSTIAHTYVGGGQLQKHLPFEFGSEGTNPQFVYLDGLEFSCPSGQTAGLTTTIFPVTQEYFQVYERLNDAQYAVQVGVSTLIHEYVGGGTIGQYTLNSAGSGYNSVVTVGFQTGDGYFGTEAEVIGVPGPGGELDFQIIDGGSGYPVDTYAWCPDPSYSNLPIEGVFRRSGLGTGENLFITCEVGAAKTTAIGRSEYFEVSNFEISNQGYGFEEGDIVEVVGLVTAKGLSQPIEPFQLTIEKIFTDNFSAWNFGELDYIDSIKDLQDGVRTRFPLIYKGELFSFETNQRDEDSAAIDLDAILLIYVNTVLQVPGKSYTFEGGTSFQFSQPPLPEDDIDVYFYRGKRGVDSRTVTDVNETIRPGDELQIKKNDSHDPSKTQDIRTVTEIASSNTVRTSIYFGNDDLDAVNPRPVAWDKQKRDIFIYGEAAPKTRDSIEPIIRPTASIIRTVGTTANTIALDVPPDLFEYESTVAVPLQSLKARAYRQDNYRPAILQAEVDSQGRVDDIIVIDGGSGYPNDTQIIIAPPSDPNGTRARVSNYTITNGVIQQNISISFGDRGSGYDQANPPTVLVETPAIRTEDFLRVPSIVGFSGRITGIEWLFPSPAPSNYKTIRFTVQAEDRYELTEISQLVPGDSIVISQTHVGPGNVESAKRFYDIQNPVGMGGEYLDCVYEVFQVNFLGRVGTIDVNVMPPTNLTGINTTGEALGYMSWGRMNLVERKLPGEGAISFDADGKTYTQDMENYPSVQRINEGLRNRGGLGKTLRSPF